jgi:putative copper resistance protein D
MDNFLLLPRALAAALSDSGFAGALGLILSSLLLDQEGQSYLRKTLLGGAFLCAAGMLLAGLAQMFLATATMVGTADAATVRSQMVAVLLNTHAGRVLLINNVLILLLILLLTAALRRRWHGHSATWLLLAAVIADGAVRSASGHAASDGDFTLAELIQFLHLGSIAIWAGCVMAAGLVVLPRMLKAERTSGVLAFTRRLSTTVTFALPVVVLSGIYNSYRGLDGSLKGLTGTQWGFLLDLKILLVLAALGMGAANRKAISQQDALSNPQASRLASVLRWEAWTMILILTVSAFLANSPPANPG